MLTILTVVYLPLAADVEDYVVVYCALQCLVRRRRSTICVVSPKQKAKKFCETHDRDPHDQSNINKQGTYFITNKTRLSILTLF